MMLFDFIIQEVIDRLDVPVYTVNVGKNNNNILVIGGRLMNIWVRGDYLYVGHLAKCDKFPLVSLDVDVVCACIRRFIDGV